MVFFRTANKLFRMKYERKNSKEKKINNEIREEKTKTTQK